MQYCMGKILPCAVEQQVNIIGQHRPTLGTEIKTWLVSEAEAEVLP